MVEFKQKRVSFILFYLFSLAAVILAFGPVRAVLSDPRIDLYYTHIPIIPLISAFLLFRKRKIIFSEPNPAILPGIIISAAGLSLYLYVSINKMAASSSATLPVFSAVLFWTGAYLGLFGFGPFKKGLFPIAFLLFAVPIPPSITDRIVLLIARASVYLTSAILTLIRIPYTREGADFHLPGFTLVVGPECAGWRSSLALIILSLLAAYLFLKEFKHQLLLVLVAIPLVVIKNAVRIILLYLIAYNIDEKFIEGGFLHRSVGYAMFCVVLVFMGFLLWQLEKREARKSIPEQP
jgi:exosortase